MSIGPNATSFSMTKSIRRNGAQRRCGIFCRTLRASARCRHPGIIKPNLHCCFLYRRVLKIELSWLIEVIAAKATQRLSVVLTPTEARRLLAATSGTMGLMLALLHSTVIRLLEGLRLRVQAKPIYLQPPHPHRPGTARPYCQHTRPSPAPAAPSPELGKLARWSIT